MLKEPENVVFVAKKWSSETGLKRINLKFPMIGEVWFNMNKIIQVKKKYEGWLLKSVK